MPVYCTINLRYVILFLDKERILEMKKFLSVLVISILLFCTGCESSKNNEDLLGIDFNVSGNEATLDNYDTENPVVAMEIEGYGAVVTELYPKIAPNTVNNFISLVKQGFYDNNSFHRLVPGFVLQGGDPNGDGTGGPGYTIKGEFTNNRFTNTLKHTKGIVSMARSTANDSAGSQFFIMLDTATNLDNNYSAFGKVIDGMDIIDKIASNETVSNNQTGKLKKNLTIKKALVDTKGKEYSEPVKITE